MATSSIEWTQATWNPVTGCTRVSAGCDHCYAATMTKRLAAMGKPKYRGLVNPGKGHFNGEVRTHHDALAIPLKRKKPTVWFVNSMSDLFHPGVPFAFVERVFALMAITPHHTYQVLTKRPERMAEFLNTPRLRDRLCLAWTGFVEQIGQEAQKRLPKVFPDLPLANVWLGTSAEDQAAADERIPHLLRCPAAVRFLSCEPLLGDLDLSEWLDCYWSEEGEPEYEIAPKSWVGGGGFNGPDDESYFGNPFIDWIIAGGESGPGARPCNVEWIRSIVQQCQMSNVPAFVKQLGAHPYDPSWHGDGTPSGSHMLLNDSKGSDPEEWPEDLRVREIPKPAQQEATP